MKIVVVSDNHGRTEPLEQILELHRDADVFIHCGDSELPPQFLQGYVCVRGNNDFYYEYPEMKILELENHRMMIVHGHHHLYMGQLDMLVSKARRQGCDFVFYGHTHIFSSQQFCTTSCAYASYVAETENTNIHDKNYFLQLHFYSDMI